MGACGTPESTAVPGDERQELPRQTGNSPVMEGPGMSVTSSPETYRRKRTRDGTSETPTCMDGHGEKHK